MKPNFSWASPKPRIGKTKYGKPTHNKGVFAKQVIRKRERVVVFGGYVMTLEVFFKLPKVLQEYPFQIDDNLFLGQI